MKKYCRTSFVLAVLAFLSGSAEAGCSWSCVNKQNSGGWHCIKDKEACQKTAAKKCGPQGGTFKWWEGCSREAPKDTPELPILTSDKLAIGDAVAISPVLGVLLGSME